MNEIRTEVLIVGGGPAGSSAGICLRNEKINCLVIDKASFPRKKLCGGLITELGMYELEKIGVQIDVPLFYRPDATRFYDKSEKIFEYRSRASYSVVDRYEFDAYLISHYLSLGGKLIQDERVIEINVEQKFALTNKDNRINYQYLIGADGANSIIRKQLNSKNIQSAFCVEVYQQKDTSMKYPMDGINVIFNKIENGFAWVFEGKKTTAIGVGGIVADHQQLFKVLTDIEVDTKNVKGAFVPYGELPLVRSNDSIFLIGDAGGYVDPIFGEGLSYAILSGRKIAGVLKRKDTNKAYLREFDEFSKMVKYGRVIQKLFFYEPISKYILTLFKNHSNLTARLCEEIVLKGKVKYYEIHKIMWLVFNKNTEE